MHRVIHLAIVSIICVVVLFSAGVPCAVAEQPAPEMQRLSSLIIGDYTVVETHHARPGRAEWTAIGTASYRPGPDAMSIVEDYRSNGPQGAFAAVAIVWWDAGASAFRHFECESGDPCALIDDRGAWDGQAIVFTRQFERQGRKIVYEERYDFADAKGIAITADFSIDGGPKTRSMTIAYVRTAGPNSSPATPPVATPSSRR